MIICIYEIKNHTLRGNAMRRMGKKAYAKAVIANGNTANIIKVTDPRLVEKYTNHVSRYLEPFKAGDEVCLFYNITPSGRRQITSVRPWDDEKHLAYFKNEKIENEKTENEKIEDEKIEDVVSDNHEKQDVPVLHKKAAGYYISDEANNIFTIAASMVKENPRSTPKIMLTGPSGFGKTTLVEIAASVMEMKFLRMNCARVREPEEWFGYRAATDGTTHFVKSEFANAISAGNVIVLLDEFNRLAPELKNTLYPLLDDSMSTEIYGERVEIGERVIFVATMNKGNQYAGTYDIDWAELNRFSLFMEVGPMPFDEEVKVVTSRTGIDLDDAKLIVKVMNQLRSKHEAAGDFSTRTSIAVASIAKYSTIANAFFTSVVVRINQDEYDTTTRAGVAHTINTYLGSTPTNALDKNNSIFYTSA